MQGHSSNDTQIDEHRVRRAFCYFFASFSFVLATVFDWFLAASQRHFTTHSCPTTHFSAPFPPNSPFSATRLVKLLNKTSHIHKNKLKWYAHAQTLEVPHLTGNFCCRQYICCIRIIEQNNKTNSEELSSDCRGKEHEDFVANLMLLRWNWVKQNESDIYFTKIRLKEIKDVSRI